MISSMTWTRPPGRVLLMLHLACAAPLIALVLWFGAVDRLPVGEGRCSSCGVEGYVIAAHVIAAAWLGAVVACAAAARREVREGIGAPGRATIGMLTGVALFLAAGGGWHPLFPLPVGAGVVACLGLLSAPRIWGGGGALGWPRGAPPRGGRV